MGSGPSVVTQAGLYHGTGRECKLKIIKLINIGLVSDDIYLNRLESGMEIDLVCYCVKGIGRTHVKLSPVCTAYYKLLNKINMKK